MCMVPISRSPITPIKNAEDIARLDPTSVSRDFNSLFILMKQKFDACISAKVYDCVVIFLFRCSTYAYLLIRVWEFATGRCNAFME